MYRLRTMLELGTRLPCLSLEQANAERAIRRDVRMIELGVEVDLGRLNRVSTLVIPHGSEIVRWHLEGILQGESRFDAELAAYKTSSIVRKGFQAAAEPLAFER